MLSSYHQQQKALFMYPLVFPCLVITPSNSTANPSVVQLPGIKIALQEHRDDTDAVKADSLTEVMAVIVSDVIEKLVAKLTKHANELFIDVTDNDCHHLSQ